MSEFRRAKPVISDALLPMETDRLLPPSDSGQQFSRDGFLEGLAERGAVEERASAELSRRGLAPTCPESGRIFLRCGFGVEVQLFASER